MFLLLLSLCCFVTLQAQELQPSYTVVAPKIVRPNSDFLVAVSLYNIPDEGGTCIFHNLHNFSWYTSLPILIKFAKCIFCITLCECMCVTVSTACGDLPQHRSHGFMQLLHSNPGETSLNYCAHLESCAKQIFSLLLTTTTSIWILIAPFVNYVYAVPHFYYCIGEV